VRKQVVYSGKELEKNGVSSQDGIGLTLADCRLSPAKLS